MRPAVPRTAGILTLDVKRKLAAAQQAAIDASMTAASGGAGRNAFDSRGAAAAPRCGYSAAFDAEVERLERAAHVGDGGAGGGGGSATAEDEAAPPAAAAMGE